MTGRLKRGDTVRLRLRDGDEWTQAFVALASNSDPSSVMLVFNGMLRAEDGWVGGALALTIDYGAATVTSLTGDRYQIEVAA
jgi:hypothetical protein